MALNLMEHTGHGHPHRTLVGVSYFTRRFEERLHGRYLGKLEEYD